jgi:hypothetical protein
MFTGAAGRKHETGLVARLLLVAGLVGLTLVPEPAGAVVSTTPEPTFWGVEGEPRAVGGRTDARVYAILEAAGRVYVGGEFTRAVAPDGTTVDRNNLIALDAATGALDTTFDPAVANAVRALEISPDGNRLYVGGPFVNVNGDSRQRIAAIDARTGDTVAGWQVNADAPVWSLERSAPDLAHPGGVLYVGGMFTRLTGANGTHLRDNLAAVDAATGNVLEGFTADTVGYTETAPVLDANGNPIIVCRPDGLGGEICEPLMQTSVQPGFVRALQMSADGTRLLVGGEFIRIRDIGRNNLAALNPLTGAVYSFNAGLSTSRRVFDIEVDADRIYAALGGGGGRGIAIDPADGDGIWEVEGNGDFQAVAAIRGVVYFGGHFGTEAGNPFEGRQRNKLAAVNAGSGAVLAFAPDFNSALGVWTLHASAHNLHVGGDFTRVGPIVPAPPGTEEPASHYTRLTGLPEPPESPTGVTAVAGDQRATVSWAAPAYDGLRPITGYTITPHRNGVAQAAVSAAASETSRAVTGLHNGEAYTFTVSAANEIGSSPASAPSAAVTPLGPPTMGGPPAAVPGDGVVELSWTEAADDGGSPVTGYVVTPYRAGQAEAALQVPAPNRTVTVTGLTNGAAYTFTVAGSNAVGGTGPASAPSAPAVPFTVPAAPAGVTAAAGDGAVTLAWDPPPDDGGRPVTGYVVTPYREGVPQAPRSFSAAATTYTVDGLANGVTHTFTVTAVNQAGPGTVSPSSPAVMPRSGYWMVGRDGRVYAFGEVVRYGDPAGALGSARAVDIEATPSAGGYWVLDDQGAIRAYGDAVHHGSVRAGQFRPGETATSISVTRSGAGYWVFTTAGRVFTFGDAAFLGDMASGRLNGPVLDSVATPTGKGYYMVASDGGIFTFGDAVFAGSMGGKPLNAGVQSMVPDPDGDGYWLVATDGGLFAFRAPFRGSMGGTPLNRPITGIVGSGAGYLMVGEDGGIFNYSGRAFYGSLGGNPPSQPIVAVATVH